MFYTLPPFLVWRDLASNGEPFLLANLQSYKDEMTVYLPKAREVYDGHFPPTDVYSGETGPSVLGIVPSVLFAPFLFLFDGDLNWAYLAAQFFFSGLIFLIFFWLGNLFFKSRRWALTISLLGVLTPLATIYYGWSLSGTASILKTIVKQFVPLVRTEIHKLYLVRIDDPMLTLPVYLLAIGGLYTFWMSPKRRTAVFAALPMGFLFYTYFHYWILWLIIIGVLTLFGLYSIWRTPSWFNKDKLIYFFVLLVIIGLMAVPYAMNYLETLQILGGQDHGLRLGATYGRDVWPIQQFAFRHYIAYLFLVGAVYWLYFRGGDQRRGIFFLSWLLAFFVFWNIQTITGFMVEQVLAPRAIAPLMYVLLFVLLFDLIKKISIRKPLWGHLTIWFLTAVIVLIPLKKAVNVLAIINPSSETKDYYRFSGELIDSWKWINANLRKEPKIVASSLVTSFYLTTYTSARPYVATGFVSALPTIELEQRFLNANKLFQVPEDVFRHRIIGDLILKCGENCPPDAVFNLDKTRRFLFVADSAKVSKMVGRESKTILEYADSVTASYKALNLNWDDIDAEYVYLGPLERMFSSPNFLAVPNLSLIYQNPEVEIYKIDKIDF